MRRFFLLIGVALSACASADVPHGHADILSADTVLSDVDFLGEYKAYHQRLDQLSFPLFKANAAACARQKYDNGVRWHETSDYPKALQDRVRLDYALGDEKHVFFVRPNSAADEAGVKPGDTQGSTIITQLPQGDLICAYAMKVRFEDNANAYASGDAIIVTSGMMRSTNDLELSLIIAHEMAHNVLGHVGKPASETRERQADRTAVFYMAAAGLDYETAVSARAATHQPHLDRATSQKKAHKIALKDAKLRRDNFQDVLTEIETLKQNGEPIKP